MQWLIFGNLNWFIKVFKMMMHDPEIVTYLLEQPIVVKVHNSYAQSLQQTLGQWSEFLQ